MNEIKLPPIDYNPNDRMLVFIARCNNKPHGPYTQKLIDMVYKLMGWRPTEDKECDNNG